MHLKGEASYNSVHCFISGVKDTGDKFNAGVLDTRDKFIASVLNQVVKISRVATTPVTNLSPVSFIRGKIR